MKINFLLAALLISSGVYNISYGDNIATFGPNVLNGYSGNVSINVQSGDKNVQVNGHTVLHRHWHKVTHPPVPSPVPGPTPSPTPSPAPSPSPSPSPAPSPSPSPSPAPAPSPSPSPSPSGQPSSFDTQELQLINQYRQSKGIAPLVMNQKLWQMDYEHNQYMAKQGMISHDGFGDRYNQSGFKECEENVAWNYDTPQDLLQGWQSDGPHNATLLDPHATDAGMSYLNHYSTLTVCGNK